MPDLNQTNGVYHVSEYDETLKKWVTYIKDPANAEALANVLTKLQSGVGVTVNGSLLQENPFGTKEGQSVVSVSESYWSRRRREGRTYINVAGITTSVANTYQYDYAVVPDNGFELDISKIIITSAVDLQIYLKFVSGIAQDTEKYVPLNISANQPFVLNFSGEMYLYSGGYIMATAYTSQVPVTFAVNTFGVEVAANA